MSEHFLEVLNVRDMASQQIPFFMHVALNIASANFDAISKHHAHSRSIL